MVKLTEIIVELTTKSDGKSDGAPARARSPDDAPVATAEPRAGPVAGGDRDPPPAVGADDMTTERLATEAIAPVRSVPDAPGDQARPETAAPPPSLPRRKPEPEPEPDPYQSELMDRLLALDRERRRLRTWMDNEEADATFDPADDQAGRDDA